MSKPRHIQSAHGYAQPELSQSPRNQTVLSGLFQIIEQALQEGAYGTLSLTVRIENGTLQRNITVTQECEHRL